MKNLKFRAWNKIVKRYQYFTLPELVEIKETIQWHNLVIEQFTGEKDCNDVDIYEGDIVDVDGDPSLIRFEGGAFAVDVCGFDFDFTAIGWVQNAITVIGNRNENKDLLP